MSDKVAIRHLPTGVPGLDEILGGGLPEFSFNLIAGAPGAGKTTLAQQIMFTLSGPDRPALYITVAGEPPLKMLRYQQQFTYFDLARVNESVRYVNLSQDIVNGRLERLLARIVQEVEATSPRVVVVDSFRSVAQAAERAENAALDLQHFVQQLAVRLTGWEATTFLVGEYLASEIEQNPVFTVADGLLWLKKKPRSELDGSQDAGHEAARTGADSRTAYVPHHRPWRAGVPAGDRRSGAKTRRDAVENRGAAQTSLRRRPDVG